MFILFMLVATLFVFSACDKEEGPGPTSTKTPGITAAPTKEPVLEKVEIKAIKNIKVGGTGKVEFTINLAKLPENAVVTYESSDTNIVTVGNDGTITAVAVGTADITVKIKVGDIQVSGTKKVVVVDQYDTLYDFEDLDLGYDLYDDFRWNDFGAVEIVDTDGTKSLQMSGAGYNFIFIGDDIEGDFVFETKYRVVEHKERGAAQINFREDSTIFNGKTGYQACIGDGQNQEYGIELRKRDGNITDIKSKLFDFDDNWHILKLEMKDNVVTAYLDGELILTHDALTGFDAGAIVICSYLDTVQYDYVKITKADI